MKLLILSTHTKIHRWRLLPSFLKTIRACLPGVTVEVKQIKLPEVKVENGRIDHVWFDQFTAPYLKEYDVVGFHLSRSQWLKLGLQKSLNGANPVDKKPKELFYFWSDERTKRKGLPQFIQTLLHELLHGYFQTKGVPDLTHQWHDENPNITVRFPIRDIIDVL